MIIFTDSESDSSIYSYLHFPTFCHSIYERMHSNDVKVCAFGKYVSLETSFATSKSVISSYK